MIVETTLENEFLMTSQQLREAITPASRILILCTPSNPTGAVYSLERLQVHLMATCGLSLLSETFLSRILKCLSGDVLQSRFSLGQSCVMRRYLSQEKRYTELTGLVYKYRGSCDP